jgi:alpha-1,6-mannosyltransferase
MPDRVPAGLGLLGPVDDTTAMADNVVRLWRGDHDAMGLAARAHVEANFSWRRTFEHLLGSIYPRAMAQAAARAGAGKGWRLPWMAQDDQVPVAAE